MNVKYARPSSTYKDKVMLDRGMGGYRGLKAIRNNAHFSYDIFTMKGSRFDTCLLNCYGLARSTTSRPVSILHLIVRFVLGDNSNEEFMLTALTHYYSEYIIPEKNPSIHQ